MTGSKESDPKSVSPSDNQSTVTTPLTEPSVDVSTVAQFFSLPSSSELIIALAGPSASSSPPPEIKSYSDAIFHNYSLLGCSICFAPQKESAAPPLLSHIDFFNPPSSSTSRRKEAWTGYQNPRLPLLFRFPTTSINVPAPNNRTTTVNRPDAMRVGRESTGKHFVECLGEPSRKGGGTGFMPLWLEWGSVELSTGVGEGITKVGVMVELRDPGLDEKLTDEQKMKGGGGPWDRAASWPWGTLKLFDPNERR